MVRPLEEVDVETVAYLLNSELGYLMGRGDRLKEALAASNELALVVEEEAKVVAFAGAYYGSPEDVKGLMGDLPIGDETIIGYKVGFLRFLVVDPDYQRKGIGKELQGERIQWLQSKGVDTVLCVAWERTDTGAAAVPLLKSSGFYLLERLAEPWAGEVAKTDEHCPACGKECHCSAQIWRWPF